MKLNDEKKCSAFLVDSLFSRIPTWERKSSVDFCYVTYIQHIHPNRTGYLATFCFQFCNLDVVDVSDADVSSTVPAVCLLFVLSKVTIMNHKRPNHNLYLSRFEIDASKTIRNFQLLKHRTIREVENFGKIRNRTI